jgi:hypothetical protein
MALCQMCQQPIKETVIIGRKLVAMVHAGPHVPAGTARYVTVFGVRCGCGERIERRFENRQARENSVG